MLRSRDSCSAPRRNDSSPVPSAAPTAGAVVGGDGRVGCRDGVVAGIGSAVRPVATANSRSAGITATTSTSTTIGPARLASAAAVRDRVGVS